MAGRPWMTRLADRAGILPQYIDCTGRAQQVSDETCERLLAALGHEAGTEDAARASLETLERLEGDRALEAVRVVTGAADGQVRLSFQVPPSLGGRIDWHIELRQEDGTSRRLQGVAEPAPGTRRIDGPALEGLGWGYHDVQVDAAGAGASMTGRQRLIMAPPQCHQPGSLRSGGMYCNLYTLRSESNWGIGNLQDLAVLVDGAAGLGMDFVGLNPLHALANRGPQICPYQPVSRLFSNELYLDIAAIPELVESPAAVRLLASQEFFDRLQEVRCGAQIPYEPIAALVRTALELLFGTFRDRHLGRETPRGCSYGRFIAAHPALQDFAAFQALDEHFRARGVAGGWPAWPAPYRRRDSEEVARFRAQNHERIAFHCYCQFELDRQLSDCAGRARAAGMSIGLYGDLALGTAADGFDTWAWPDLFASGASVGAPPDPLAPTGQNWALPPLQPRRLRDDGYRYWADLLRAAMSWAGAVRIDHVMGLGRQYWIPAGLPGSAGAYVRYPADELFAVLALESHRHRVVVVGEDLGTVEPGFREQLARWGLFSSQVLYLERDPAGEFVPASSFMRRALATVNTHDMVPLAGYLNGDDLALHRELGQYSSAEQEEGARTDRRLALAALQRRLQAEGLLEADAEPTYDQWCCAVHRFLSRTPARLVAVSLDDVAGETAPVNVPGVGPARRINWSRRMGRDVRALLDDPSCRRRLAAAQPAPAESDR